MVLLDLLSLRSKPQGITKFPAGGIRFLGESFGGWRGVEVVVDDERMEQSVELAASSL